MPAPCARAVTGHLTALFTGGLTGVETARKCAPIFAPTFRPAVLGVAQWGMTHRWTLSWIAGPDAGGTVIVGPGEHIVGRAAGAAVRCDDAALEPHHLLLEATGDGHLVVRQLTGRVPVRIDGEPIDEPLWIAATSRIEIGHSVLTVAPTDLTAPGQSTEPANITATPSGRVLVRRPRAAPTWAPEAICLPRVDDAARSLTGGVLPAVLALAGSAVLAAIMRQPMFLLFGALGAIVAFGTWGGQRVAVFRRRRCDAAAAAKDAARFESEVEAQRRAFVAHHAANDVTPGSARRAIAGPTADLWARRATHADAFEASIGVGNFGWTPRLEGSAAADRHPDELTAGALIADLPILADLGAHCRLALRGAPGGTAAIVRSLVVQLAADCGPADVRIVVVTHEPARWQWLEMLPHARTPSGSPAIVTEPDLSDTVTELDAAAHVHVVVITDAPDLLAARTSPLRRIVASERSVALLVLVEPDGGIPHVCTSLLDLAGPIKARWHPQAALASLPIEARCSGISAPSAVQLIARLADLIDPEDPLTGAGAIPRTVTLRSLLGAQQPAAIAASWLAGGADPMPRTVIGVAGDGVVDIDLVRDGPHALIAGTTGAGKSELLRSLVVGLAAGSSPDHLTFVLIDYKGGSTFDACADLPHVVGVVTDLDDRLADRALRSLRAELRRREQLLRQVGAADLTAYRRLAPHAVLPRLVVIVDEFAALVTEQPVFLHALVGIAQRGRSLGVHLILATQRPNGVISDDIRANTNLRLALRLHDAAEAIDVVGDRSPAAIPRGLPGRAVMRLGPEEVLTFQTASCTSRSTGAATDLDALVAAIGEAVALVDGQPPVSPWLPALPATVPVDAKAVEDGVLGVIDDPDHQCTHPLRWVPTDGNLLLVGATGSGVTSTLALVGGVVAHRHGTHLYVVDGRGDALLTALEQSPRCVALARLHERERLIRVIHRLAGEIERRAVDPAPSPPTVVLIDGLDALRASLDDLDTAAELDMLDRIVADGAAHGIAVVAGVDRAAAVSAAHLAHFAQRWIFHLTDRVDAVGMGVPLSAVPGPRPGRVVVAATGLEAQILAGPVEVPADACGCMPAPIECLPCRVDARRLPCASASSDGTLLPIGVHFGDAAPCAVDVPDGEHVLIIGPPRSGRSTTLQRLVRSWRDAHPDGWWATVAPRRTILESANRHRSLAEIVDDVPADGPVLIAVDDAELVDDVGGALAALAAAHRHGVTIVATGKPDSLRQSYGHWTGVVRRSRLGIIMTASSDLDGDLLGAVLPRRTPIPPRPGLAWLVSDGSTALIQVAVDDDADTDPNTAFKCARTLTKCKS